MSSRGDLLRVVGRIEQMVTSQYNKYRKQLASAKHSLKFKHSLEAMPFLPPGIHEAVTPPAIDRIREQDLLRQKERRPRQGGYPPVWSMAGVGGANPAISSRYGLSKEVAGSVDQLLQPRRISHFVNLYILLISLKS